MSVTMSGVTYTFFFSCPCNNHARYLLLQCCRWRLYGNFCLQRISCHFHQCNLARESRLGLNLCSQGNESSFNSFTSEQNQKEASWIHLCSCFSWAHKDSAWGKRSVHLILVDQESPNISLSYMKQAFSCWPPFSWSIFSRKLVILILSLFL